MSAFGGKADMAFAKKRVRWANGQLSDTPPVGNCEQMLADAEGAVAH